MRSARVSELRVIAVENETHSCARTAAPEAGSIRVERAAEYLAWLETLGPRGLQVGCQSRRYRSRPRNVAFLSQPPLMIHAATASNDEPGGVTWRQAGGAR